MQYNKSAYLSTHNVRIYRRTNGLFSFIAVLSVLIIVNTASRRGMIDDRASLFHQQAPKRSVADVERDILNLAPVVMNEHAWSATYSLSVALARITLLRTCFLPKCPLPRCPNTIPDLCCPLEGAAESYRIHCMHR